MFIKNGSTIPAVAVPTESSYKGHPVLTLPNVSDPKAPGMQFGVRKLQAVLEHLDAVKAFVAKHKPVKADSAEAVKVARLMALLKAAGVSAEELEKAAA